MHTCAFQTKEVHSKTPAVIAQGAKEMVCVRAEIINIMLPVKLC